MSLTSVIELPETRAFLKSRIRRPPGLVAPTVRVPPAGANPTLLGIAFDYALRLGLAARYPCEDCEWVAEIAPDRLMARGQDDQVARAEAVLEEAISVLDEFPNDDELPQAHARACYLLSGLDLVVRPGRVEHIGVEPTSADLAELLALYRIVPWERLKPQRRLVLNPTFGDGSHLVGGADADFVVDDLLVDVKTNRDTTPDIKHLRQIVGYALLANFYAVDSELPQELLTTVGLYQARAGALTTWPLETLCPGPCQHEIIEHLRSLPRDDDEDE